ncbi:hypothetical protein [Endozoicomonas sp. SCSIO W0465]|uniref:hypothetical protein n=1 Tax=Endozoicomonas sp. SCSIO W0465 TaxID=2918516 RepID=UPI002074E2E0|nr:hypothetical protein [Endozoicomonas sp. SCSIO W0465]USE36874.1 hypothetical protein MJO57_01105 [Endozoicomonas sp. SCSIO W0465]
MKTTRFFSLVNSLISAVLLTGSLAIGANEKNSASVDMQVSAEIPDFIKVGGLPETVPLTVQDNGTIQSDLLKFYVVRNGASVEKSKGFLLKVKSSEGNKRRKYFLANKEAKQKMFIHVGLGEQDAATIDDLKTVPSAGIEGETHASFDTSEPTHTLALFNKDLNHLYSRAPGKYSANFTITVQAK